MSSRNLCGIVALVGYAALLLLLLGETPGRVGVFLYLLSTCCLIALWVVLQRAQTNRGTRLVRVLSLVNIVVIALLMAIWKLSDPVPTAAQAPGSAEPPQPAKHIK